MRQALTNYVRKFLGTLAGSIAGAHLVPMPYYYQLDVLKLNEGVKKVAEQWRLLELFQAYLGFARLVAPDAVSQTVKRLWEGDCDHTAKRIVSEAHINFLRRSSLSTKPQWPTYVEDKQ